MHLSFLPLLLLAWVIPISAQERITQNPHTSPADVVAGGRIYRSHCVECHGRDGTGGRGPSREGTLTYPSVQGATNWYSPSYSPRTELFYLSTWEYASVYFKGDPTYVRGNRYIGSFPKGVYPDVRVDVDPGYGAVRALDPRSGERKWEYKMTSVTEGGILTSAGDVLFSGNMEGHFFALDVSTGKLLWNTNLGGRVISSPITYEVGGKQHVTIAAGHSLYTFVLKE